MGSPLCALLPVLLAACCHLGLASGERTEASGYREEIVFPERLAGVPGEGQGRLLYRLRASEEELLLELEPDPSFLAEGLTVQYLGPPTAEDGAAEPGSYYTGTVNGDPDSVAAVSYDGLSLLGVLQYRGAEYHVQPLARGPSNAAHGAGAHVLRSKRPERAHGARCSVGAQAPDEAPAGGREPRAPAAARSRAKRFASVPRYVEMLVVADEHMARFHGAGLKRYLLTVIAAAAKFFRHPSLRNPVTLVVTRLVVLGSGEDGLQVTSNAAQMLRNFCQWQKGLNKPDDADSEHFDTAILFTRQDLCGVSTCDTLGMADVGTVCDPTRSCSIVEDDGLQAAFTAAHELGKCHQPGKAGYHGAARAQMNRREGSARHMMAPVMSYVDPDQLWSPCSARFITDFLDNGHGKDPPGAWSHDTAGRSQWVDNSLCRAAPRHCPNLNPPCSSLWCTGKINGQFMCQTKHFPWADGTACGQGKTCMSGRCISKGEMKAFNVTNLIRRLLEGAREPTSPGFRSGLAAGALPLLPLRHPDPRLSLPRSYGYNDVVTIPAGATHILIRQTSSSATTSDGIYLALRRRQTQQWLKQKAQILEILRNRRGHK
nr:A disintegrin and metalloproteinase with thrombospondin motifs 4 [Pelodiscus sinensis]|eukprot:XP_025036567.1 A disintegrin and metalloproteinase with thrombospondin motifs 4 [Pelodiscus sinensis]